MHTSKEEHKIGISGEIGEIGRWKSRMRVKNLLISRVHRKKKIASFFGKN